MCHLNRKKGSYTKEEHFSSSIDIQGDLIEKQLNANMSNIFMICYMSYYIMLLDMGNMMNITQFQTESLHRNCVHV